MGRMFTPTLYAQRVKGIIIDLRKTVYVNVYLHINLTLLKAGEVSAIRLVYLH